MSTLQRPEDQRPVKRTEPLWRAVILARAASQAHFMEANFDWRDGWTAGINVQNVTVYEQGVVRLVMPIYEAARLKIEGDS